MRVKSNWFKSNKEKTPQEIAGAVAFISWRIAQNAIQNLRRADFEIPVGKQYFDFLGEFIVFLILVSDRIAYSSQKPEYRTQFTVELFSRCAETYCENMARLLEVDASDAGKAFVERFNSRSEEYSEFGYDRNGPDFAFTRHFAHCLLDIVADQDKSWVIDRVMTIDVPEAITTIDKALKNLLSGEPRSRRAGRQLASAE